MRRSRFRAALTIILIACQPLVAAAAVKPISTSFGNSMPHTRTVSLATLKPFAAFGPCNITVYNPILANQGQGNYAHSNVAVTCSSGVVKYFEVILLRDNVRAGVASLNQSGASTNAANVDEDVYCTQAGNHVWSVVGNVTVASGSTNYQATAGSAAVTFACF